MARILVVDDSPTDVAHLRTVLGRAGHEVLEAGSGEQAIEMARQRHPDCIVMDVVMPGVNGFQATRTLSKSADTAQIPIIVISSKSQESDRLWALRQGAREYLVKPLRDSDLLSKVDAVLQH